MTRFGVDARELPLGGLERARWALDVVGGGEHRHEMSGCRIQTARLPRFRLMGAGLAFGLVDIAGSGCEVTRIGVETIGLLGERLIRPLGTRIARIAVPELTFDTIRLRRTIRICLRCHGQDSACDESHQRQACHQERAATGGRERGHLALRR